MEAQTIIASPVGEYYLGGVPETACGFKISEDSTFQFFFSQGALDRFGEGKWEVKGNRIVLNSRKRPAHDFALIESKKEAGDQITLQITEQNEILKRYVQARITGGGKTQQAVANAEGVIKFDRQPLDTIELVFEFCPEKSSVFTISEKEHNHFEYRFETWMMELFFENFTLEVKADGLSGGNPVLMGDSFNYRKSGAKE